MRTAAARFDGSAASVASARRFVRDTMTAWRSEGYEPAATTVVSELATNAVLHAGSRYTVTLTVGSDALTVEVSDGDPRPPVLRRYGADAATGRGVRLVAAICRTWQVEATPGGKTVRCEIPHHDTACDEPPRAERRRTRPATRAADRGRAAGTTTVCDRAA